MRMRGRGPAWLLGAVAGLAWMGTAAADEDIRGVGITRTIDCAGGEVRITGTSHRLTLSGRCERVVLSGTGSTLHVESLGRLTVSGINHRVEWVEGLDGNAPRIQKSGIGNEVVQVKAGAAATSRGSAGTGQGSGTIAVEGEGGQVTIGGDGVTVQDKGTRRRDKDKVTVNSGGTTVAIDGSTGTVTVGGPATAKASGGKAGVTVAESGLERAYDCAGGSAVIQGNDNMLTLRNCPELVVHGNSNTLTLQGGVKLIRALGNANEITWSQGVDGGAPNVESLGSGNNIKRSGR
jgi:hypothetical protein